MSVLIMAFDGLDHDLIKKYQLDHIPQNEFDTYDNTTGMTAIKTSELFASFITGTTHEQHGITGIQKWSNPRIEQLELLLNKIPGADKLTGIRTAIWESINRLNAHRHMPVKDDLQTPTLFDEIPDSKALFVPSYTSSWMSRGRVDMMPLQKGGGLQDVETWYRREHLYRKNRLYNELNNDYTLLMCHFHKADVWQHLYAPDNTVEHEEKIRDIYEEMDELAAAIKNRAADKYDRILFMSDHGLPTDDGHNKNAFYSCNRELFPDKTPHITDFFDNLLSLTEKSHEETVGIKV